MSKILRILDDYIFELVKAAKTDVRLISFAVAQIAENPAREISEVQKEVFITERSFQRLFEQKIGISPVQYRRVAQFNSAFQQLNRQQFKNFADIAFSNQYSDQSHFIRAFRQFTNMNPSEYLRLGSREP